MDISQTFIGWRLYKVEDNKDKSFIKRGWRKIEQVIFKMENNIFFQIDMKIGGGGNDTNQWKTYYVAII